MKKIFRFYEIYDDKYDDELEKLLDESILEDIVDNRIKYITERNLESAGETQDIEDFTSGKVDSFFGYIKNDWHNPFIYQVEIVDISSEIFKLENKIKSYKKEIN